MNTHHVKEIRAEKWKEPVSQMMFLSHWITASNHIPLRILSKQTLIACGSISQGSCYFQLKTFLVDTFQSYPDQAADPFSRYASLSWFRMFSFPPCATSACILKYSVTSSLKVLLIFHLSFWSTLLTPPVKHVPILRGHVLTCCFCRFWYPLEGQRPQLIPHLLPKLGLYI